jgi:uncharacterized protein involved in response to NO
VHTPADPSAAAILQRGFRPFFLLAAAYGCVYVPLWLGVLGGLGPAPGWNDPITWHAHEMLFGMVAAAIAGFLLTSVPVWTQTPPVVGAQLASLVVLWSLGRHALLLAGVVPPLLAALLDVAFLPALAAALAGPLLAPSQRRNVGFLAILLALASANATLHAAALGHAVLSPRLAVRGVVDGVAILLVVIGGRITPAFTRSAFARAGIDAPIAARPWLDRLAIGGVVAAALTGVFGLELLRGVACTIAGAAVLARLSGWQTRRVLGDPLLWSLHLGQAWLGIGLLLGATAHATAHVPASIALHALSAGAMGATIAAVMTRVALGHTGRPLVALPGTAAIYLLVSAGAFVRVLAPIVWPAHALRAWTVAGLFWSAGFGLFLARYGPILMRPRIDGRAG